MKVVLVIFGLVIGVWMWGVDKLVFLVGGLLGWLVARSVEQRDELNALKRSLSQRDDRADAARGEEEPIPEVEPGEAFAEERSSDFTTQPEAGMGIDSVSVTLLEENAPEGAPVVAEAKKAEVSVPARVEPVAKVPLSRPLREPSSTTIRVQDESPSWIMEWFTGGNLLVRGGSILLFFGAAFLFKYAAEHVYLPVWLRMGGVALAALAMIGVGQYLRERRTAYALALQGGGVGLLYMTVYASFRLYDLLPAGIALTLLAAVAGAGVAMAVCENARWLAVISFAGGFLAPLLASTGGGNHVALFSWYAVLNIGIAVLAYYKSWRELSLMGLGATFAISGMWGWNYYRPEHFDSVEPFLIGFGLLYLMIGILFTQKPRDGADKPFGHVDASLIFGTPVGFFMLQTPLVQGMAHGMSLSTAIAGIIYAGAAYYGWRGGYTLLARSLFVIAITLLTLTAPLELDAAQTSAFWAMEGVGLLWLGIAQRSSLSTYTGLGLQFLAAAAWFANEPLRSDAGLGVTLGGLLIAFSAWVCAVLIDRGGDKSAFLTSSGRFFRVWGLIWWFGTGVHELSQYWDGRAMLLATLLLFSATALLVTPTGKRLHWPEFSMFGMWQIVVIALFLVVDQLGSAAHPLAGWGGLIWPCAVGAALWLLYPLRDERYAFLHWGLPVFYLLFSVSELNWLLTPAPDSQQQISIWQQLPLPIATLAGILFILFARGIWPMARFPAIWVQQVPAAGFAIFAVWLLRMLGSPVDMAPFPYLPLSNPVDAMVLAAALLAYVWRKQCADGGMLFFENTHFYLVLGGLLFLQFNADLARMAHHWFGIAWSEPAMMQSVEFQAMVSICWSLLALALMFLGNRKFVRIAWLCGAVLLAVVAAKLFLVDLSGSGTLARVVSFLGVGVLMLVIGYVAPVPPAAVRSDD